jgi:anti-sigma-K factor RskA
MRADRDPKDGVEFDEMIALALAAAAAGPEPSPQVRERLMARLRDEAAELTGLYVLDALTADERDAFEAHMAVCARCAVEIQSLRPVASALGTLAPPADPSPAVRARMLQAIRARHVSVHAAWLAAAAALVIAVGAAVYAVQLRRQVRTNQTIATILAAPDLTRIDLQGQQAAPSASARALWSRSRGLVFTASNLPPAPAGRVYQLWVLSNQPAPISAGLMKPDASGRVTVAFATPPDLPQPVAMAVTLEPDGGVPSPTGDKYLVGAAN